jgi:hypothetical protein
VPHTRPHFLHLGPGRTGTSWLFNMLGQHPDVRLNPVKEIRYFSELYCYPEEGLLGRFRNRNAHNQDYRDYLRNRLRRYFRYPFSAPLSLDRIRWDFRYLFGRRSDDWFESLFNSNGSTITGDFSPQTQFIPPQDVVRIAQEWPATKAMLTLRDPVDWAWSCAKMWLMAGREAELISDAELSEFIGRSALEYPTVAAIKVWDQAFAGRFKLLYFDDIASDPPGVLHDVCDFLGLSTAPIARFKGGVEARYSSRPQAMPPRLRRILIDRYRPEMRDLAERYGGYPQHWLERYSDQRQAADVK